MSGRPRGAETLAALAALAFKVQTANSVFQELAADLPELPQDIGEIVLTRSYLLAETGMLLSAIACLYDERRLMAFAGQRDFDSVRRDLQAIVARGRDLDVPVMVPLDSIIQ